jgi:methylmalonyl-CoA carboxyltransferase 12S subunit
MNPDPTNSDLARLVNSIDALRREVAALADRVTAIEAAGPPVRSGPIDQETAFIIAAAVAAFLGKRAHVRQIRLLGSEAWARQGRVTVQASHALSRSSTERSKR